jgi:acetyltransferase-like isoleucine patch superfamily enzyme
MLPCVPVSFLFLLHCALTLGFILFEFQEGYQSIDRIRRTATYTSTFAREPMLRRVNVSLHLQLEDWHITLRGNDTVFCDAVLVTAVNTTRATAVQISSEHETVIKATHPCRPGKYTVVFYTSSGVVLEQTDFEIRIVYQVAPAESYCILSERHPGIETCDQYNIGRGSYHALSQKIFGKRPWTVNVGQFCSISSVVLSLSRTVSHRMRFITTFPLHHMLDGDSVYHDEMVVGNSHTVTIGNDVWIGMDTVIINNVTIGDGAVIGSNSVIRKSVPPYAIVYGNPAVVVRYRFGPEVIEKLQRMQWWDWEDQRIQDMARYTTTEEVIEAWESGAL